MRLKMLLAQLQDYFRSHRLVAESAQVAAAILVGKTASFFWKILTANQGTHVVGEIEYILTTTTLLAALAVQGLPMAVTIWTAKWLNRKKNDSQIVHTSLAIGISLSIVVTGIALFVFNYFPGLVGQMTISPQRYLWTIPLIVVIELMSAWFNGRKQYIWYSFGKYAGLPLARLSLLALLLTASTNQQTQITAHINGAVSAVALILSSSTIFTLMRQQSNKPSFTVYSLFLSWSDLKQFWQQSMLLSGSLLLYIVYTASDVYLLSYFHNPSLVGVYSLLLALASLLEMVFYPILNLLQARLSNFHDDAQLALRFLYKNMAISAGIGIATALLLVGIKPLVVPLFGMSATSIPTSLFLLTLIWKLISNTLVLPIRHYLDYFNQQKITLNTMSGSFILKVLLSLTVVPSFGIAGILIANTMIELIHAGWLIGSLRRYDASNCN